MDYRKAADTGYCLKSFCAENSQDIVVEGRKCLSYLPIRGMNETYCHIAYLLSKKMRSCPPSSNLNVPGERSPDKSQKWKWDEAFPFHPPLGHGYPGTSHPGALLVTNASLPQGLASQAESTLHLKLQDARMGLLDLSARNRLLNTPRSAKNARTIEIVDEKAGEVFRLLVVEERALTFTPGRASASGAETEGGGNGDSDEIANLAQPEDETVDERGVLRRHADLKLQTRLTSKGLQKRLFEMHSDSVLLEQEQGVNILFLAIGMLKWIDPNNATNIRYAPLILVPVSLERGTAADRFKLKWRHEDQSSNLSLEAYLDQVHGLKLPMFETGEDCDPAAYAKAVAETVVLKDGWQVLLDDMVLGFFSFAKFLMYRDLDVECWPEQAP